VTLSRQRHCGGTVQNEKEKQTKRQNCRQSVVTGRQQLYCAVQSRSPSHCQTTTGKVQKVRRYLVGKYVRPQNCGFSDIFGPDMTPHVVALCMGIAICHRRKFGQVWGSPAPLPEVAENLRSRKAPIWTFDYHMERSESFCNITPGL